MGGVFGILCKAEVVKAVCKVFGEWKLEVIHINVKMAEQDNMGRQGG